MDHVKLMICQTENKEGTENTYTLLYLIAASRLMLNANLSGAEQQIMFDFISNESLVPIQG